VRWLLQPWLDRLAGQLHVPLESASIDLMRTLARDGVGVAFQTRLGLERELAAGQLVFVPLRTPGALVSELGCMCGPGAPWRRRWMPCAAADRGRGAGPGRGDCPGAHLR
jgi:DNA-binding transcriptional LysR family regulator